MWALQKYVLEIYNEDSMNSVQDSSERQQQQLTKNQTGFCGLNRFAAHSRVCVWESKHMLAGNLNESM